MARYTAIRAVGESVLELMREACPADELQLGPAPAFELASLGSLTEGQSPPADGFYLILWRVGIGGSPRNLPPRRARDGQLYKPSLPVDLYFLLLPVASRPDKQTQMLGWALTFLHQLPALSGEVINRYTKGGPSIFRPEESVELIADPLSTVDYLSLWDRVKSGFQAGMTYVARMVLLDIEQVEPTGAPVTERRFVVGAPAQGL
ncbi:Pvc16 family protein [Roseateles sp. BYS96W]|uniref:Pvc16 family protein n=1 Tax=Pelomonas nitida TaxID=3299027 RepID=A0ABW7G7H3_9BURK